MDEWTAEPLPAETVAGVRGELGPLADGIIDAVRAASPIYGEVLGSPEGMALRLGIEQAIRAFLDAVERGGRAGGPNSETDELWRRLGEAGVQAGGGGRIPRRRSWGGGAAGRSSRPGGASTSCGPRFAWASAPPGGAPPMS